MYNAREKSRSVLQKYVNLSSPAILLCGIYVKSVDEVCITTKYFTPSRCAVLSLAAVRLPYSVSLPSFHNDIVLAVRHEQQPPV